MSSIEVSKAMNNLNKLDISKIRSDYMLAKKGTSIMSNADLINVELLALKYGYKELIEGIATVLKKTFYDNADEATLAAVNELSGDLAQVANKFDMIVKSPAGDNTYI